MTAAELQELLAAELPITQHLGIRVGHLDAERLELVLPLGANRNHKGTAFAGSLNAVATLAGWGTLVAALARRGIAAHVVIQDSAVRYLEPVRGEAVARCRGPDDAALDQALATFARRGKARVRLEVEVFDGATRAVSFGGRYVLHRSEGIPGRPA